MTAFRADLAALDALIARLRAFEAGAQTVLTDLESSVERLHVDWSGWAAHEHSSAHREWAEGAARMHAAVSGLRSVVSTAHGNYAVSSSANARMWG